MNLFNSLANGPLNPAGSTTQAAAKAYAKGLEEMIKAGDEHVAKTNQAFEKGFGAGLVELTDAGSVGTYAAESLAAFGFTPKDTATKELVAGVVNASMGNPIAIKDFLDFAAASGAKPEGNLAAPHSPPRPGATRPTRKAREHYCDHGQHGDSSGGGTMTGPMPGGSLAGGFSQLLQQMIAQWAKGFGGNDQPWSCLFPGSQVGFDPEKYELKAEDSEVAKLPRGASFEDLVAAFMIDVVKEQQNDIRALMDELKGQDQKIANARQEKATMQAFADAASMIPGIGGQIAGMVAKQGVEQADAKLEQTRNSRQLVFEQMKNAMNKLQQMQQALSNVLNAMHQGAMNSIRNIK